MLTCLVLTTALQSRTADHPSQHVLQHLVAVAGKAAAALTNLISQGPELLPALRQQQQEDAAATAKAHQHHKKRKGCSSRGVAAVADDQELLQLAWLEPFMTPLGDFDAWIVLRKEAVPFGERSLPLQQQRLKQHLQQLRAANANVWGEVAAAAGGVAGGKKRKAGGSGAEGSREEALGGLQIAPKQARAVLRAFPQQVIATQPTEQLLPELLVGFDPVKRYVDMLTERYGHLGVFCCDSASGFGAVGVKWRPEAFLPQQLHPAVAHGVIEIGLTGAVVLRDGATKTGSSSRAARGSIVGLVVPNIPQVLMEMQLMGLGLVQEVLLSA
jgi:U3 small nucleolar RNA-associated protein 22